MAFNNDGPTIPIIPLGSLELSQNGSTPAIQMLQNAFQQGAIDFETINRHFGDAPRLAAESLANQAKAEASKGEIAIQPLKNERNQLEGEVAINQARYAKGMNPRVQALETAKVEDAERKRRQLVDAQQTDERYRAAVEFWQNRNLGPLPKDPAQVLEHVERIQKYEIDRMSGVGENKVGTAEILKRAVENGIPTEGRSIADIEADVVKIPAKAQTLTPVQREEEVGALQAAEQLASRMKKVSEIIEGKRNVVGAGAGSALGQGVNVVKEVFGFPEDRNAFREVEMLSNDITAAKTKLLKGPLSEKELAFIKASVPRPTDDEATWRAYLSENLPIIEGNISARRTSLETGAPIPVPEAAAKPTPKTPRLPGGLSPASDEYKKNWDSAKPVTSTKDWADLPPTSYYIYDGDLYQKK